MNSSPPVESPPLIKKRPGLFAAGLVLAALTLFLSQATCREVAIAINHGRYVREVLELEYFSEGGDSSPSSVGCHIVSNSEHFVLSSEILSLERLRELSKQNKIDGFRMDVWYLPDQGARGSIGRFLGIRVLSLDHFGLTMRFRISILAFNLAMAVASYLLIRRGLRGLIKSSADPPSSRSPAST